MERGKEYKLRNGDSFSLLGEDFIFTLEEKEQEEEEEEEEGRGGESKPPRANNNAVTEFSEKLKRKLEDTPTESPPKVRKVNSISSIASNPNGLPECPFGSKCYRKNPQHLKEMHHPHEVTPRNEVTPRKQMVNEGEIISELKENSTTLKNSPSGNTQIIEQEAKKLLEGPKVVPRPKTKFLLAYESSDEDEKANSKRYTPKKEKAMKEEKEHISRFINPLTGIGAPEKVEFTPRRNGDVPTNLFEIEELKKAAISLEPGPGFRTIAFPPIATGSFQFDCERAAQVGCEAIFTFLKEKNDPHLQLILVIEKNRDPIVSETFKKYSEDIDDSRFQIHFGCIATMKSTGIPCRYIVNECNWRFKSKSGRTNKIIHQAASNYLEDETKKRYPLPAKPGGVYPVPLPAASPLYQNEGVQFVFHCLAPNMNPQRPDCLNGDYEEGKKILKKCYENVFDCFSKLSG